MNDFIARQALERMNMRPVAVAAHYQGIAADLKRLSEANASVEQESFLNRRNELCQAFGLAPGEQRKPFAFSGGIAVIPVHGTLINRFNYSWGYVTGYNFIRSQALAAEADPDVKGIIFDLSSYGGEAAGCFECARDLASLTKPTVGIIDAACYSACYAIGSAMSKLISTPSGGAGSIGVVAMHIDVSKALEEVGIKVTFIHAGEHKVDGNPYEPLSKDVKADIQKRIDAAYDEFVSVVAEGREMDEKKVRATEARIYTAQEALSLGLIDAVESPNQAAQAFFGELSGSKPQLQQEPIQMANEDNEPGAADQAAATAKAAADARAAERARVSGIQSCEEAKGREKLASHLALNTEMSVDDAKAILAASPKEAAAAAPAPAATNPLQDAMAATGGGPKVGADSGAEADQSDDAKATAGLLANFNLATGQSLKLPA